MKVVCISDSFTSFNSLYRVTKGNIYDVLEVTHDEYFLIRDDVGELEYIYGGHFKNLDDFRDGKIGDILKDG